MNCKHRTSRAEKRATRHRHQHQREHDNQTRGPPTRSSDKGARYDPGTVDRLLSLDVVLESPDAQSGRCRRRRIGDEHRRGREQRGMIRRQTLSRSGVDRGTRADSARPRQRLHGVVERAYPESDGGETPQRPQSRVTLNGRERSKQTLWSAGIARLPKLSILEMGGRAWPPGTMPTMATNEQKSRLGQNEAADRTTLNAHHRGAARLDPERKPLARRSV